MMPSSSKFCLRSQSVTSKNRWFMSTSAIALTKRAASKILVLRNQKVILDSDSAELYGVSVKQLNQQIKRNKQRFPADFVFTLTNAEHQVLRSQIVTSNIGRGGRRY